MKIKTIWKFELKVDDVQILEMPLGAEILTVQAQKYLNIIKPCLWALVDPTEQKTKKRHIETFGTGNPIYFDNNEYKYVGTYQLSNTGEIYHIFEYIDLDE
jgi:hypothetical protein